MSREFEVKIKPDAKVFVESGATILDAITLAGFFLYTPCGGSGRCFKCKVKVSGKASSPTALEKSALPAEELKTGMRLACQARVQGNISVEIPILLPQKGIKTISPGTIFTEIFLPSFAKTIDRNSCGIALDIGTTTIAASCIELFTGIRRRIATIENPQGRFGSDIMTRIEKCMTDSRATKRIHELTVSEIAKTSETLTREAGFEVSALKRAVAVGNTTMIHFLLGKNPSSLGKAPFKPRVKGPFRLKMGQIGLLPPEAELIIPRLPSGFIGADTVAALLATKVLERKGFILVCDLGTNGEIALAKNGEILACSTAAGPAFEGRNISCGMIAAKGAISSISLDGSLTPKVLGGGKPIGICGSGLLDAIAALRLAGILSQTGKLVRTTRSKFSKRIRERKGESEFIVCEDSNISLTQSDIREFQLAKAAVAAGIKTLCERAGISLLEVERVYLSGTFGSFLKPESASIVGIFPKALLEKIEFAQNAPLLGSEMILLSENKFSESIKIADSIKTIELASDPVFKREFLNSLSFP